MQIKGLGHSLFDTRSRLRARFERALSREKSVYCAPSDEPEAPDEAILSLLLDTTIVLHSEASHFKAHYEQRRSVSAKDMPSFEEAIDRGWFRVVWGARALAKGTSRISAR